MRTDTRYTRVLGIITDDAIPRTSNGGIAMCHSHQRQIMFAGGFFEYLLRIVERMARHARYVMAAEEHRRRRNRS